MRYVDCCKSTRKNKKCTRKDGKHFSLQRRFSKKKCIKGPVKGFTMRASCAPYKFCKKKGGAKKTRKLLPKLRKISYKNKKHHYKLKDPFRKRKLAIHEGVNREAKKTGKTKKKAAIAKKGRFNILRIYRKNKKIKECNTITHDMRYMDRKYGLGKTKNICGQKGGMISEFISDDEETNNEPEPNTYFIVKNTENQIKNFAKEISKRIVEGQYMHHGYETFYYLEQLEATMLEALFSRENINGFYIVTYYPNNNSTYGGFSESFYNNLQVLHEHLQITEANNRFPNNTVELEVSVLGEQDDPNTVAGVTNFTGGRKHHRKKTRKKKGGTNPLQFRGKRQLIELLLGQIGPDYEGAIFETKEYNFIQRNWGNNKIYIKKENLDDLDEEAISIPNYTIDDNDNPTNNIFYLHIDPLITGLVRIRKKDGEWFISEESQIQLTGGYKKKRDNLQKSILNEELQVCSKDPMTGFTRDGYCRTNSNDSGSHLVCAKMDQQFLDYTKSQGNDLSSVVKDGENWCLCQDRWLQAHKVKKAPKVIKSATNSMIHDDVKSAIGQKGGTYNFPPERPDSTFTNIDDLKFILSFYSPHNNNKIIIKSYTGDEDEHQLKPELASDTHILIVGADYGIPFFLLQGGGFEIKPKGVDDYLTYVPPQQQGGSRKKRGGVERWRRETLQPNPEAFDDIGYFYDCKPIVDPSNKSKYRENMIITGDRDGNQLMLPHKLKIIRMDDSEFYDPELQLVDMREREGLRGMAAFRRRAQDLCNRGYKPLKRNDVKTGAGRKKKTRKKRGGWRRRDIDFNKDDIGYYYDCWNRDGNYDDVKYREGMTITGKWDVLRPISEWDIIEMQDSHRYDPNLILYDESRPNFGTFRIPAQQLCSRGFKPLKRNDAKTGSGRRKNTRRKRGGQGKKNKQTRKRARQEKKGNKIYESRFNVGDSIRLEPHYEDEVHNEYSIWDVVSVRPEEMSYMYELKSNDSSLRLSRPESDLREAPDVQQDFFYGGGKRKKKTRKKRKKKQFLYNPNDPSKSFDVYIDKNPNDTIPIKYTTVKDVKDTIKKLERLYKTKKYPHKRIWQVGMIMKVRLEAMLKHKTKKYPNAKKVKQRFNLANKYFKFLGKRTKKNDFKSRKAMTFKF